MLCFEIDLYPGYVTEKPLEAWASGCIPLWRGTDSAGLLNPNSHLNAASFESIDGFVEAVSALNQDKSRLVQMGTEPLFSVKPSLHIASEAIRKLLD
jgi:hypothetical protein